MRRTAIAVLVLAWAASGCAVHAQRHARVERDESVPFELLDQNAPPLLPPASSGTELVALCFGKGDRLALAPTLVKPDATANDIVEALRATPVGADASLRTALGDPPIVRDVRVSAGVAHVDLEPVVATLSHDEQLLGVAQLVCTLTGRPGIGQVAFTLEGAPISIPRGDGSLTTNPVSRDDYSNLVN
jgi:spore germination protein GerM